MTVTAAQIEGRSVVPTVDNQPLVTVKVTRKGHGKISTGVHDRTFGDELYADGERFAVAENIALELEDRGFVVIVEDEAPKVAKVKVETPKDA